MASPGKVDPYAPLRVYAGPKETAARPIAWDANKRPSRYITTCTNCKKPLQFSPPDVKTTDDGMSYVQCACKYPPPKRYVEPKKVMLNDPIRMGRMPISGASHVW